MYIKQDLINDLKKMSFQPIDTVLVHSFLNFCGAERACSARFLRPIRWRHLEKMQRCFVKETKRSKHRLAGTHPGADFMTEMQKYFCGDNHFGEIFGKLLRTGV